MKNIFNVLILFWGVFLLSCGDDSSPNNNIVPKLNILKLMPSSGAVKVSSKQVFEIEFDNEISSGSGYIQLFKKNGDVLVEELNVSSSVSFLYKKISFNFTDALEYGVEYYILIDSGSIMYNSSYSFEGISSKTDWSFTSATLLERENTVVADLSGALTKHFVSDTSAFLTRFGKGPSYNFISGETLNGNEPMYELSICYPFDYVVNTEFDLAMTKWPGFYVGTFFVKTTYYIDSGTIKLTEMNDDYIEGVFNFTATGDNDKKLYVKNGYFFVKH